MELAALPLERGELGVSLHYLPDVILRHLLERTLSNSEVRLLISEVLCLFSTTTKQNFTLCLMLELKPSKLLYRKVVKLKMKHASSIKIYFESKPGE